MKQSLLAVLTATALCSSGAAQAEESYVKFGIGQGHYKDSLVDGNEGVVSLAFGQSLSENLGFEIGYMHFGERSKSDSTTMAGVKTNRSLRTQSLYVAAVGTLPLHESFSLFGKLGVAANYSEAEAKVTTTAPPITTTRISDSETTVKPMVGFGAVYNFSKELAATVEYQHFGKVAGSMKVDAWTVGLKYGF